MLKLLRRSFFEDLCEIFALLFFAKIEKPGNYISGVAKVDKLLIETDRGCLGKPYKKRPDCTREGGGGGEGGGGLAAVTFF